MDVSAVIACRRVGTGTVDDPWTADLYEDTRWNGKCSVSDFDNYEGVYDPNLFHVKFVGPQSVLDEIDNATEYFVEGIL